MNNIELDRLEVGNWIYFKDKEVRKIFEVEYFIRTLFGEVALVDVLTGEKENVGFDMLKRTNYILLTSEDQIN